jgi:WXXGXW repeat (2 copies)
MRHYKFRELLFGSLVATALAWAPLASRAQIRISINIAPPPLPVYVQPPVPAAGYLWVPGYWAWSDGGYYWVPGTWVEPPEPGLLWTPGYWGWTDGVYVWNEGYWAPQVGFYGGVHYGFGYDGNGYVGGRWDHGVFFYNTAVNRIPPGLHITHVFRRPVPAVTTHVSFNGGVGGLQVHATAAQLAFARGRHVDAVAAQHQQEESAARNGALRASNNHGHPGIAATARPGQFSGPGVIPARGAPAHAEIAHHGAGPGAVVRERAAQGHQNAAGRAGEAPRGEPRFEPRPERQAAPHAQTEPRARSGPRPAPHAAPGHPGAANAHENRGREPAGGPPRDERKPQ